MDFRSEVFKLCKIIQKRAETNIVNDTYLRLFTSKSEECVIPAICAGRRSVMR